MAASRTGRDLLPRGRGLGRGVAVGRAKKIQEKRETGRNRRCPGGGHTSRVKTRGKKKELTTRRIRVREKSFLEIDEIIACARRILCLEQVNGKKTRFFFYYR